MADIVMADDGVMFDGNSLAAGPLGGAETAFLSLARAFAARGHRVRVANMCRAPMRRDGVDWAPLAAGVPDACDLYIANRSDKLILRARKARRAVFSIHNPARYLLKTRYLWKLWLRRPAIVFSGAWHAATYPAWAPSGARIVIPLGISDEFRQASAPDSPPPPRAVFTSSPMRGLDWLLDLWRTRIRPASAAAELHLYTGAETYGGFGAARAARMRPVLEKADGMRADGVVRHGPVSKAELAEALRHCRVALYRGDPDETFCLAIGEAQAVGVPAVVQPIGCVAERVVDGKTGFVARDDDAFAAAAIRLLSDDALWQAQSTAARAVQRGWGWNEAAAAFEGLIG